MRIFLLASFSLLAGILVAQETKKEKDIKAIKSMSGCYRVGFNFIETFNYSKDSTYKPSKEKRVGALEWVEVITDKKDEIQLQHLLIVGEEDNYHIVKHWRQDWLYQNQELYLFDKDKTWKHKKFSNDEVKGQWTQKVFQVDDSPRYEGSATWVHVDGRSFWENTTDAPLARREHTQRSDYNVLRRRNRHEIIDKGWLHIQDNDKVIRKDNTKDILLAQEKGYNTYIKIPDNKCIAAKKWWKENQNFWKIVRNKWNRTFKSKKDVVLKNKIDDKPMFIHLFEMDKDSKKKDIEKVINTFLN